LEALVDEIRHVSVTLTHNDLTIQVTSI
jgi:hypothetical protein